MGKRISDRIVFFAAQQWRLLKKALATLLSNDPLRMAGATAFFASFAMPAIFVIIGRVLGAFAGKGLIAKELLQNFGEMFGYQTAGALHDTVYKMQRLPPNRFVSWLVFIFLIFVATTLMKIIKNSLEQLWGVQPVKKPGLFNDLASRARSFAVIILAGLLSIFLIPVETFTRQGFLFVLTAELMVFLATAFWIAMIFKFVPVAVISWKEVWAGSVFTALLLTIGKWLLRGALSYNRVHAVFGSSTTLVIELLFIFYASLMFYFGACFTKCWAAEHKAAILPEDTLAR